MFLRDQLFDVLKDGFVRRWLLHRMSRSRSRRIDLQRPQKSRQCSFLFLVQLEAADDVEKLHRILESRQTTVVQIGRRIFDPSQHERLNGTVRRRPESLKMKIMHLVVRKRRRLMTEG